MGGNRFAVFLGGKVNDSVRLLLQGFGKGAAPEAVQVFEAINGQLGLHFQTIGPDPVKGSQQPVKPGEDAQVLLYVIKLVVAEESCMIKVDTTESDK